jgi:hypothetical protein
MGGFNAVLAEWIGDASTKLRETLDELEGVSQETLERIDQVSRPTGGGPTPGDPVATIVYQRLVLLALAENALARQRAGATKATKAS